MLKKLQGLLFEEDDDDIEEEEEEVEVQPAAPAQPVVEKPAVQPEVKPVEQPKPQPEAQPEPVMKAEETVEVRPAMQRIDVTQQIPVQQRRETARTESVFREKQERPAFNIKADEKKSQPAAQPAKPKAKPAAKTPKREEKSRSGYQFQPVISPIFGVDEKDMNALKTTTTKISEAAKAKNDPNISPIISPMYGVNEEDKPSSIQKSVRKSNEQEKIMATPASIAAEDDIPDFSLDDILKERDEAYANAMSASNEETAPLFPDLNLWDEEPESADDATIVIEKPVK